MLGTPSKSTVESAHKVDPQALAANLFQDAPLKPSRTFYAGVESELLPSTWRVSPPGSEPRFDRPPRDRAEARTRIREVLGFVVGRAIGDARRVGVFASGGIDSSTVVALATREIERRGGEGKVVALAIDFESAGDDRPHLMALQRHLGCEVTRVKPEDGAKHIDRIREGLDSAPVLWPFSPVQLALFARAREEGVDCVLTGVGGDDFFDGDPRALSLESPRAAIASARALDGFGEVRSKVLEYVVRPHFVPLVPRSLRRWRARRHPRRPPPWAGPLFRDTIAALDARTLERVLEGGEHKVPRWRTASFDRSGNRYFAWLVHQEQRGVGIDRYDPMFTEEVASVLATIPEPWFLEGDRRRGLLREAMRGEVPDSILDRPDKAEFAPAFLPFLRAIGGARCFGDALEGRHLSALGIVSKTEFRRAAERALEAPEQDGLYGLAWAALAAEAFLLAHPEVLP